MRIQQIKNNIQLSEVYQYIDKYYSRIKKWFLQQHIRNGIFCTENEKRRILVKKSAILKDNILIVEDRGGNKLEGVKYRDYILIKYDEYTKEICNQELDIKSVF